MRAAVPFLLWALTACSAEPPSGPTPLVPPNPTPAPQPPPRPQTRPLPFEGAYELSVSAAAPCAPALPPAVRVRRYHVVVRTNGERTEIVFENEDVWSTDGQAYQADGFVRDGRGLLDIHAAEWLRREPPSRAEAFYIMARSEPTAVGPSLEGKLAGTLEFLSNRTGSQRCTSERHDFRLRPR